MAAANQSIRPATAIMMLPVATSVIALSAREAGAADVAPAVASTDPPVGHFALCLLLGIAYAASIGGMGTPIGTPPNRSSGERF